MLAQQPFDYRSESYRSENFGNADETPQPVNIVSKMIPADLLDGYNAMMSNVACSLLTVPKFY